MYLEYFKLREEPFRLTPDSDYLYMSSAHSRAKSYMDYTIWNRDGFVVITGDIGCGKTTVLQRLISELDENVLVAKIFQTQLDEVEFLQAVLVEFGLNPFNAKKVELIDMLNTFLIDSFLKLKQLVLIVDDAHNLSTRVLEEIRMLSSLETNKQKLLHVILVGQSELNHVLEAPEMEQLLQRVRLRYHIKALGEKDVADYIRHRLDVGGAEGREIVEASALPIIYKYTGGVPRLINTLCDTALTCAFADGIEKVSASVVEAAIDELQWVPYAKRTARRRAGGSAAKAQESEDFGRESAALLASINNRIGNTDSLVPAVVGMAKRLQNVEALLREMVDLLQRGEQMPAETKKRQSG
jgi:type II secretory pathway predicted ATPase ExeA